jgi:hypothetical protein
VRRIAFTILAGFACSAWAAGQALPRGATAGERMERFARNSGLVGDLVNRGVELANTTSAVARAEAAHGAARDLGLGLKVATADEDGPRAAELAEYLDAVIREALVPSLGAARDSTPPGSPDALRIEELRKLAAADIAAWVEGLNAGKLAKSPRTAAARKQLAESIAAVK